MKWIAPRGGGYSAVPPQDGRKVSKPTTPPPRTPASATPSRPGVIVCCFCCADRKKDEAQ